ncbi:MAG: aminotransferase class V-fold PLP-dependent enzyme [Alphaproteobacteria bacterium]|nr:aminotransferase class V-fold PLP-dependent enzyme [Alphaproteobacteria bacterium]
MNKIIYLDAAATMQKPDCVIGAEVDFLRNSYANAGRGICTRAVAVDDMVAATRRRVAEFINADANQVVFTSGATDGLNRVVNILTRQPWYAEMSTFAVSDIDHHSARLPWQELMYDGHIRKMFKCELDENFDINPNSVPKTDFLVITAMSNVLGRSQDVRAIIAAARRKNPDVVTIVDASQYVVHEKIDVKEWDCDFLVFSGHKIGADTGVGILYIRDSKKLFPDKFGGGMVLRVGGIESATKGSGGALFYENNPDLNLILNESPEMWEAGTLPLSQIAGLTPAIDYLEKHRPNLDLIKYAYDELEKIPKVKILTTRDAAILSFVVDGMHPLDVGALIGANDICVRAGNMCAAWIHTRMGIPGSIRISVGSQNTIDDINKTIDVINKIVK